VSCQRLGDPAGHERLAGPGLRFVRVRRRQPHPLAQRGRPNEVGVGIQIGVDLEELVPDRRGVLAPDPERQRLEEPWPGLDLRQRRRRLLLARARGRVVVGQCDGQSELVGPGKVDERRPRAELTRRHQGLPFRREHGERVQGMRLALPPIGDVAEPRHDRDREAVIQRELVEGGELRGALDQDRLGPVPLDQRADGPRGGGGVMPHRNPDHASPVGRRDGHHVNPGCGDGRRTVPATGRPLGPTNAAGRRGRSSCAAATDPPPRPSRRSPPGPPPGRPPRGRRR
jgi:hypothetical protein